MKKLYVSHRFYIIGLLLVLMFIISFFLPEIYKLCWLLVLIFSLTLLFDITLLFSKKNGVYAKRITPEKFSNGDDNIIEINIENNYNFKGYITLIDEIPFQFQVRDFEINTELKQHCNTKISYTLRPTERGEYHFGNLNIYIKSPLQLICKRYKFDNNKSIATYPSYIQLKKYELITFSNQLKNFGLKKIRKIGNTLEFEQIKEYVQGDDLRTVNWKATAKRNQLMVNQYQDEKSQNIYLVIDKGRTMQMPFNGLSLLDYAINSTLVLSNIIIKKQDKAGMFTFSKKVENRVFAERRNSQMNLISENLYNIKTNFHESDYSKLYVDIKKNITHRSLIILYTNFETIENLDRQLIYLKAIANNHLLVVVFFENTELTEMSKKKANTIQEVYDKVIAEKFCYDKKRITNELNKHGIHTVLSKPEDLTINSINKYLEIKARGLL